MSLTKPNELINNTEIKNTLNELSNEDACRANAITHRIEQAIKNKQYNKEISEQYTKINIRIKLEKTSILQTNSYDYHINKAVENLYKEQGWKFLSISYTTEPDDKNFIKGLFGKWIKILEVSMTAIHNIEPDNKLEDLLVKPYKDSITSND